MPVSIKLQAVES